MAVDADVKVTSMGFETSNGVMHVWATIEGDKGSKLYEKRTRESLEALLCASVLNCGQDGVT